MRCSRLRRQPHEILSEMDAFLQVLVPQHSVPATATDSDVRVLVVDHRLSLRVADGQLATSSRS